MKVRQPIGGDFGFSRRLAQAFLSEKTWTEDVAHFGIDIWMTTVAIARRFKVCQTFLGSPKSHRAKDPAKHLGLMFTQVMMTFFELMVDFEYFWKDTTVSWPSNIFGFGLGLTENPPPISVNTEALYCSFTSGFKRYCEVWGKILPKEEFAEIKRIKRMKKEQFYYHSDLWARILFNFAIGYRNNEIPKEMIIESMIPFYHSRILSFVNKTIQMNIKESEEYLESIVRVFEDEKTYLVKRWDEGKRKVGNNFFHF